MVYQNDLFSHYSRRQISKHKGFYTKPFDTEYNESQSFKSICNRWHSAIHGINKIFTSIILNCVSCVTLLATRIVHNCYEEWFRSIYICAAVYSLMSRCPSHVDVEKLSLLFKHSAMLLSHKPDLPLPPCSSGGLQMWSLYTTSQVDSTNLIQWKPFLNLRES